MIAMDKKHLKTINREFAAVQRQEDKLMKTAVKAKVPGWKPALEQKVPAKVYEGLNSAFCKAFSLVFQYGRKILEMTFKKKNLSDNHAIRNAAFQIRGSRKDMKQMHKSAKRSSQLNIVLTTVEGIGLGALGVGMPDIVLFLTTVLRGVYETALHYGFDYESRFEQMLILKMMAASLSTGEDWFRRNKEVNDWLLKSEEDISEEEFQTQIRATSNVFAVDMLLLKFIQGMPVVGVLGGAANPLYYNKVMRYVQVKYKKRYLLNFQKTI